MNAPRPSPEDAPDTAPDIRGWRHWPSHAALGLMWLLHFLPLTLLAPLGRGVGALLWLAGRSRRRIALRNLALCLPELSPAERLALAREHFALLGRSLLERSLLWHASPERLRRLIHIEGNIHLAQTSDRPVMWLTPHFLALDVAGVATQVHQGKVGCSIYQAQSNPVFDAAMRRARLRFGLAQIHARGEGVLPVMRAIRRGTPFFNLPDMDFGLKDAAFVPFMGVSSATLLTPSKMAHKLDMVVQPVIADILPGGQGYRVHFMPPLAGFPTADALADTAHLNEWIAAQVRLRPAQYLWVHRRFKTRPDGQPPLY
ncbi:lipid A biosynthesis acyltransferase [Amphibiibacter pelophylacis]|uniref:Lipid A biosynthesis acyltransferase n=1 Tax=Amphibiibacter pelophylacis TaxID=1799477 RepID=A0ACC6P298_9BURK